MYFLKLISYFFMFSSTIPKQFLGITNLKKQYQEYKGFNLLFNGGVFPFLF